MCVCGEGYVPNWRERRVVVEEEREEEEGVEEDVAVVRLPFRDIVSVL